MKRYRVYRQWRAVVNLASAYMVTITFEKLLFHTVNSFWKCYKWQDPNKAETPVKLEWMILILIDTAIGPSWSARAFLFTKAYWRATNWWWPVWNLSATCAVNQYRHNQCANVYSLISIQQWMDQYFSAALSIVWHSHFTWFHSRMGNKPLKSRSEDTILSLFSPRPPPPVATIPGRNSTIKSILRNNNNNTNNKSNDNFSSKDSSSISSNSSVSKQNVTFSDEIINGCNSTETLNLYNDNLRTLYQPMMMNSKLSYSTETLKSNSTYNASNLPMNDTREKVKILYAKDYQSKRRTFNDEPLKSDCELMPAYSSTFAVRVRPSYHTSICDEKLFEPHSMKVTNHAPRINIANVDVFHRSRGDNEAYANAKRPISLVTYDGKSMNNFTKPSDHRVHLKRLWRSLSSNFHSQCI